MEKLSTDSLGTFYLGHYHVRVTSVVKMSHCPDKIWFLLMNGGESTSVDLVFRVYSRAPVHLFRITCVLI